jgi:ribosome-binding factor A
MSVRRDVGAGEPAPQRADVSAWSRHMRKRSTRIDRKSGSSADYFGGDRDARERRKDAQLCEQVREAIDLALAESRDDDLSSASAMSVEPAPHIGHLRVTVMARGADPSAIERKLEQHKNRLRAEVAAAIHRKKVPAISFVVVLWPEDR